MATVHRINSKGAMACGFWDALPFIKALLSKRDQGCVKKRATSPLTSPADQTFSVIYCV